MARPAMKITGVKELVKNFDLGARDVRNFARGATHKVASIVTKRTRKGARKHSGTLRKHIKSKRRRARGDMFRSDVIIRGVATKGRIGEKGAPYYWYFLEYGTVHMTPKPFVGPALDATRPEAHTIFRDDIMRRAIKAMERRA